MIEKLQVKNLRAKQACQYLGIGYSTFWRWVKDGKTPQGKRVSERVILWEVKELDAFLEQSFEDAK